MAYLDCPVQGSTCKGVGVLGIEHHLHDIVGMPLEHLGACPILQFTGDIMRGKTIYLSCDAAGSVISRLISPLSGLPVHSFRTACMLAMQSMSTEHLT